MNVTIPINTTQTIHNALTNIGIFRCVGLDIRISCIFAIGKVNICPLGRVIVCGNVRPFLFFTLPYSFISVAISGIFCLKECLLSH